MLRILIVDDHPLFRDGVRGLISTTTDMTIVGEAANARDASLLAAAEQPDIAILDVGLPGKSGLAAIEDIRKAGEGTVVLILSGHGDDRTVARAFSDGADGYALKDQPVTEILEAIRAVARGETYLAPTLPRTLLDERERAKLGEPLATLTQREREVFDLVVRGMSTEDIGKLLFLSGRTVETHRARINRKLDLHSPADAMRFAHRHGLSRK